MILGINSSIDPLHAHVYGMGGCGLSLLKKGGIAVEIWCEEKHGHSSVGGEGGSAALSALTQIDHECNDCSVDGCNS